MKEIIKYFEYSEEHGLFHRNDGEVDPNSHGYQTIDSSVSRDKARLFGHFIVDRYGEAPYNLSFKSMKNEWVLFEKFLNHLAE